jgi:hypothetical protein
VIAATVLWFLSKIRSAIRLALEAFSLLNFWNHKHYGHESSRDIVTGEVMAIFHSLYFLKIYPAKNGEPLMKRRCA